MSFWQILGIEPTSDERAIRRAYAKKLKTTRPDEDPEGYQELREAFDNALSIAPFYAEEEEYENQESLFAEESQQDYFSADQEPVVDWNNEDLVPNFNQEGQEEQEQPFISEAELMASMPVQESQDWYSQPVDLAQAEQVSQLEQIPQAEKLLQSEQQEQFEQAEIEDDYAEDELHFGERLYWEIDKLYREYGSEALFDNWEQISQEFSNLPLGDEDTFSWNLLRFLLNHEIDEPKLWFKCSEYFNWLGDYRIGADLSPESLLMLQEQVNKGKILLRAEKKLAKRKQNQPIDIHEIPPDIFPISQAIYYRLGSFWQNLIMYFYGFFLYQNLKDEHSVPWWEETDNCGKIKNFVYDLGNYRALLFIALSVFIYSYYLFFDVGNASEIMSVYISSITTFFAEIGIMWIVCAVFAELCKDFVSKKYNSIYNGLITQKLTNILITLVLPTVLYLLVFIIDKDENSYFFLNIFLFCILALFTSIYSMYYLDTISINDYLFYIGLVFMYFYLDSVLDLGDYNLNFFLLIAILWRNTVMHIVMFYHELHIKIYDLINKPFETVPYDIELLLFPFYLIRSAILWLFFLPLHFIRGRLSFFVEILMATSFIMLLTTKTYFVLFFYPTMMMVYAIYALIRNKLLRNLEVIE